MEGLSVRTVFMNVFVNLIVLLYLINNETSMMILISNAVGLLIEVVVHRMDSETALEGHKGCEDPVLLEGKSAGVANSRSSDVQYEQDEGV